MLIAIAILALHTAGFLRLAWTTYRDSPGISSDPDWPVYLLGLFFLWELAFLVCFVYARQRHDWPLTRN